MIEENVEPDCFTDRGCLIPDPGDSGRRIMQIYAHLAALRDVVDPGTVLRLHGVTLQDLDLLAVVAEVIRPAPQG